MERARPAFSSNRRRFLQLSGLAVGGGLLAACAPPTPTASPAGGATSAPAAAPTTAPPTTAPAQPTAAAAGQGAVTIALLGQAGSGEERVLRDNAAAYQQAKGVTVNLNPQPWETLMEKIQADIRSSSPTYDIFWSDLEFAYTLYPNLLPLNDLIQQSNYAMDGFFPSVTRNGEGIGGQPGVRYGLPIMTDTQMCWYRSDKIKTFPSTWDDFEQMLKEYTGGGKYALGNAGVVAQGIGRFLSRYWSIPGTTLMDQDWNPKINGDEGVHAMEMYQRQATNYSPPGFQAWEYTDAVNAFLNGDVLLHEGWPEVMLPSLTDPTKNKTVGDNWSAAPYPEKGSAQLVQHNLILFKSSKNAQAAFDFMAYNTNKDMAKSIITKYRVDSPRQDVWQQVLSSDKVANTFYPGWSQAMSVARPVARPLPQWLELQTALGEAVTAVVAGQQSAKDALDQTADRWKVSIAKGKPTFPYQEIAGV